MKSRRVWMALLVFGVSHASTAAEALYKIAVLILGIFITVPAQAFEPSHEMKQEANRVRRVLVRVKPAYRLCVVPFTPTLVHGMFVHRVPQNPDEAKWVQQFPEAESILTEGQSCFMVDMRSTGDLHGPKYTEFTYQTRQGKGSLAHRFEMPRFIKPEDPARLPYHILDDVLAADHDFLVKEELGANRFKYSQVSSGVYCGDKIDFSKPFVFHMIATDGRRQTFHWP